MPDDKITPKLPELDFKPKPCDLLYNWQKRAECRERQLIKALIYTEEILQKNLILRVALEDIIMSYEKITGPLDSLFICMIEDARYILNDNSKKGEIK